MNGFLIFALLALIVLGIIILIVMLKNTKVFASFFDNSGFVHKQISTFLFTSDGELKLSSVLESDVRNMFKLSIGQHISECKSVKRFERYFETCKRTKKSISLKLVDETEANTEERIDIVLNPLIAGGEVVEVAVILQRQLLGGGANSNKDLEKQRNYALKQIDEIEAQKAELEQAFKKSSKHHIMLQKALRKIEAQKDELERAIKTINEQKVKLEKANREITASNKMKEIFLANTSHEIRTPLNAILGFTNLLLNTDLSEIQKRYINNIQASGNNLLIVINDILDFSKIESGKLTLEEIEFDFVNLIKHNISTLQIKADEKQISLRYDLSSEIPSTLVGDPVRLSQILINLLGNAIKFTNPKGFVRLFATTGKAEDDDYVKVLFKIEDNGIGIPQEKLKDIFSSFTQGESYTTRKYGGTGLGLSIVKQLVKLQQGEITVESQVGRGTTFTFYILLKRPVKGVNTHIKHSEEKAESSVADYMKILLVEDNVINQQLAFDTIKAWNNKIDIQLATNGKEALQLVKEKDYDLILMDIQMPEMDGNEATRQIRLLPSPKNKTPIMAMTAHALKNEKEECFELGMNDYISKPFDPNELFKKIVQFAPSENKQPTINKEEQESKLEKEKAKDLVVVKGAYSHFNTVNLEKIYKGNTEKIKKIVDMCRESIPDELEEIQKAYNDKDFVILRNKVHALKPKLGYLGMESSRESAKAIELMVQQESNYDMIQTLIEDINKNWNSAVLEIEYFLKS